MKLVISLVKILLLSIITISLSSCGYKPTAKYARVVVGEKISTSVVISLQDPENTVFIKDALDEALLEVFNASLTSRKLSETHLQVSILNMKYTPVQYDKDGYVIAYRTSIAIKVNRVTNLIEKKYIGYGTYDFSIVANAVVTDQERFDAIRHSAIKAIKSFVAQVSAEGARSKKEEK